MIVFEVVVLDEHAFHTQALYFDLLEAQKHCTALQERLWDSVLSSNEVVKIHETTIHKECIIEVDQDFDHCEELSKEI